MKLGETALFFHKFTGFGRSLFLVQITMHKDQLIELLFPISLIVAKIVGLAIFAGARISEIVETISFFPQIALFRRGYSFCLECRKYRMVFFQYTVDCSDHRIRLEIMLVIVGTPALISTKFLVSPARELIITLKTSSFIHNCLLEG